MHPDDAVAHRVSLLYAFDLTYLVQVQMAGAADLPVIFSATNEGEKERPGGGV